MSTLSIKHITTYKYKRPVAFGEHRMMLRPLAGPDQNLLAARLVITPTPARLEAVQDAYGNHVEIAHFAGRASELRFESTALLDHSHTDIRDLAIEEFAQNYPFAYRAAELADLAGFINRGTAEPNDEVERWARAFLPGDWPIATRELLIDLTHGINRTFKHVRRDEKGIQAPLTTLALGSGSCRDLAMLMIDAVRSLGMAARFVSGYLHIPGDDEIYVGGGNTHAWAQVFLPGPGWVDFDPSNGIVGNRDLVRVAVVPDPRHAIPLYGTFMGKLTDYLGMKVDVLVTTAAADAAMPDAIFAPDPKGRA